MNGTIWRTWISVFLAAGLASAVVEARTEPDPAALAFFENEVRPLLAARCQKCHGPKVQKGNLRLDSRAAILAGGRTGPAIEPGKPEESLLIDAIRHGDLVQMPPKSKLPDEEIATLTRWVAMGAPWTGDDRPAPIAPGRTFDLKERARHWSFQPIRDPGLPDVQDAGWPRSPVDRFILSGLESRGLAPAPDADKRTLIRRLTFDLIGLPPSPAEIDAFLADESPDAWEKVVDRLLASPHHGERWARHWLDLVRFAETAGHEFDYDLLGAWRYRDYVIRAFNADVPYDQLVIEHLAGDLIETPRRHSAEGFNESIIGTGFFLLGEGTHSPVDVREEEVRRIDNQIDVLSKTFLGLTVACARCHDHKFDPISTRDYYALAGYLRGSRPRQAFLDPPDRFVPKIAELASLRAQLTAGPSSLGPEPESTTPVDGSVLFEDFGGPTFDGWFVDGPAFGDGPSRPGDFRVGPGGIVPVAAGQAHSGLVSDRLQGVLRSRTFRIERKAVHYLAMGRGGRINLVIDGFKKIRAPIYGGLTTAVDADDLRWFTQNVAMWVGHDAYIEIADGATEDYTGGTTRYVPGDGFLCVDQIRFSDGAAPTPPKPFTAASRSEGTPTAILSRYREVEARIPEPTLAPALVDGTGVDERVMIRGNYKTPGEIVPRRFLEVIAGTDQPAPEHGSGRLELARRIVDPSNPLLARVMVNRIWRHHFGAGIVASPDDFGLMGDRPTDPELLDFLASRFIAEGWSIKRLHRLIVTSHTYRMQSRSHPESDRADPTNRLLHRMNVRRLEAEAIRDAMLAVSGRLDPTLFGRSEPVHLTPFMSGRGRPADSGPLDGEGRRSLYISVRRNFLTPMLLAFDFPAPATTMGRRNVSNVPAQALTLLNDPFVLDQARHWADRVLAAPGRSTDDRLTDLYISAFGRPPTDAERDAARAFLDPRTGTDDPRVWANLCHVLLNVKEFLFVN